MLVTRTSKYSGLERTMEVPVDPDALAAWDASQPHGPHIQNAFPGLSADHREFLLSGCTPKEWESMFGDDDEDDDYDEDDYEDDDYDE